jgi:glycosyltransferase involved in cell wall biosynthesis
VNFLQVTPLYHPSPGGAERHCREVSERLAARGHRVSILTADARTHRDLVRGAPSGLPASETMYGVHVSRVPTQDDALFALLTHWTNLRGGYRSAAAAFTPTGLEMLVTGRPRNRHLVRGTLAAPADIVLAWNWVLPAAYHAYLAHRLRRFPLVGVPLFHTEEPWARRPIYDRMLAACDGLIVNTAHEADYIRRRVPAARRIVAIGPGVTVEPFARPDAAAFRRRHRLGDAPLVGFVGRICAGKGVPALVEAMRLVWRRHPEARLVLAGYLWDGQSPEALLAPLDAAGRARVVLLPDFPEAEKADLYAALDVFAMPSVAESFGIAYLEAWLCRKPVVGSRIGAIRCVIADGEDGLLAEPGDPGDIARAIQTLLCDPARRADMGERGRAKTLAHFTWDAVTDRIERFCAAILDRGAGAAPRDADGAAHPSGSAERAADSPALTGSRS